MSLSTFGGEINHHCNFDLNVRGLWNGMCPQKKNELKGGKRKRMLTLHNNNNSHGTSCWGCEARFSRNSR
jgi:hypothetical protein